MNALITTVRRQVYTHAQLRRLIDPASVAIVGLSRKERSFGARTAANLRRFGGELWGVNPSGGELHGVHCYESIDALPSVPDCVVLAVPVEATEALVEQCAAAGVGGCVIFASGFAETGREDRIALQRRLSAIASASSLRIVGPNCIGLINNASGAGLSFVSGYAGSRPPIGRVAIASQSGGLGQALAQASRRGGGWSHYMAAGNSCDVDVCDYVSYLADDPACGVIACIAEGLKDGSRLIEAGERALATDKPLLMYKIATGAAAAQAAMSHTGTLAGSNAAFDAAYARAGIVKIDNIEDIFETASFFAKAGRPSAPGVAAVAASGGACVIALDKAERHGVAMPKPAPATRLVLEANIPDFGNPSNPCDITAQVATNPASYAACAGALLADPQYGALVVMTPSIVEGVTPSNVAMLGRLAAAAGKPLCMSWMSEWKQGPGAEEAEANPHVALFRSTDRAFATLAAWIERAAFTARTPLDRQGSRPATPWAAQVSELLAAAGNRLTERESKQLVSVYGVKAALDRVVQTADEAIVAAETIGYPVVLKVESADIPHKTEAGVVRLALRDAAAVKAGFEEIVAAARSLVPSPNIAGVLVQPMIGAGLEMVVGARLDPTFGPIVVVGLGGILVELLHDTAVELAPVDRALARSMVMRLKGAHLLTGFRGSAPVALDPLIDAIVGVSELIADHAAEIAEIDVNPIICSPTGAIAVDALVIRTQASDSGEE